MTDNGPVLPPSITLTIDDPLTFHLKIDLHAPSLDYALNMLAQATRALEIQQRFQAQLELTERQRIQAVGQAVRDSISKGRAQ
jgi:hypothetical protein